MTGMVHSPQVSVVMAVFNGEPFVAEAIRSVLGQTLTDFEFIVVDDGSRDRSCEIVRSFADPRIRLLGSDVNRGLAASLNRGIAQARGVYVARMDCDDISLPRRLERQVAFLQAHPQLGACGTWVETFGGEGRQVWRAPISAAEARLQLLFDPPMLHPTVMFRRELFARLALHYDESFAFAQDYELWERASHVTAMANLGEVLLRYRRHAGQAGRSSRQAQSACADAVRCRCLKNLGLEPEAAGMALHSAIASGGFEPSVELLRRAADWLGKIYAANQQCGHYDQAALGKFLGRKWWGVCGLACHLGLAAYRELKAHPFHAQAGVSWRQRASLLGRCCVASLGRTGGGGAR